jgi:hypothetical protein
MCTCEFIIDSFSCIQVDWVTLNYVPFGEKCLTMAVNLYEKTYKEAAINQIQILTNFVHVSYIVFPLNLCFNFSHNFITLFSQCIRLPMSLKYDCTAQSTWRLAVHSFVSVLRLGLPVVRTNHEATSPLWTEITLALDEFLFPKR